MFLWGCRHGVQWGISLRWQYLGLTWMWSGFEERLKEGNSKGPALGPCGITGALPAELIPSPDHPPFVSSTCGPVSTLRPQGCSDAFRVPSVSHCENQKVCFWSPLPSISRGGWAHALRHASDWGPLSFLVSPSGVIAEQSGEHWEPIDVSLGPSRPLVCATDGDIKVLGGDVKWLVSFREDYVIFHRSRTAEVSHPSWIFLLFLISYSILSKWQSLQLGGRKSGLKPQLCCFSALWYLTIHPTLQNFSFLIYRMAIIALN